MYQSGASVLASMGANRERLKVWEGVGLTLCGGCGGEGGRGAERGVLCGEGGRGCAWKVQVLVRLARKARIAIPS
jgi:hypothetical protein